MNHRHYSAEPLDDGYSYEGEIMSPRRWREDDDGACYHDGSAARQQNQPYRERCHSMDESFNFDDHAELSPRHAASNGRNHSAVLPASHRHHRLQGEADRFNDSLTLRSLQTTPRRAQHNQHRYNDDNDEQGRRRRIEIVPGLDLPLRGASESYRALEQGFFSTTPCPVCQTVVACIEDADYMLCPDCRVVSPLVLGQSSVKAAPRSDGGEGGGVGLGVRFDCWLAER